MERNGQEKERHSAHRDAADPRDGVLSHAADHGHQVRRRQAHGSGGQRAVVGRGVRTAVFLHWVPGDEQLGGAPAVRPMGHGQLLCQSVPGYPHSPLGLLRAGDGGSGVRQLQAELDKGHVSVVGRAAGGGHSLAQVLNLGQVPAHREDHHAPCGGGGGWPEPDVHLCPARRAGADEGGGLHLAADGGLLHRRSPQRLF